MSIFLIVLVSVLAGWAALATVLAMAWGRGLRREREEHEEARERNAGYRDTVRQMAQQAATVAARFEALQREHAALQQSLAAHDQEPPAPVPLLQAGGVDVAGEVGALFEHVARVALAVREHSAYTRGHYRQESNKARYDLLWLADSLHTFDQLGRALAGGNARALAAACGELAAMYDAYPRDGSGYDSRDTFRRLAERVPLAAVGEAIRSLAAKATQAQAVAAQQREAAAATTAAPAAIAAVQDWAGAATAAG
jgi:hypothetical protein